MQPKTDKYHYKLAEYFWNLADSSHDQQWKGKNTRPFLELPFQLVQSDKKKLSDILWNPYWYRAKLKHTDIYRLHLDFKLLPDDEELNLISDALDLSAKVLSFDKSQLANQLIGRLLTSNETGIQSLLQEIISTENGYWLRPLVSSLSSPGGPLLRTLEGNGAFISAAVTADGKIVSGGLGNNLIIWELKTGRQLFTLQIHKGCDFVSAIAITSDGKVVAAVNNLYEPEVDAIEVWDIDSGQLLKTIEGYSEAIKKIAVTSDGKLVSLSYDSKLKVWDLSAGRLLIKLEDHPNACGIAVTSDGRAISVGGNILKVWDLISGALLKSINIDNRYDTFQTISITNDEKIFTISSYSIRLWDIKSVILIREIQYPVSVNIIAVTANNQAVTANNHAYPLKRFSVWDMTHDQLQGNFEGHTDTINDIAVTADNKIVSASSDKSLKVWDLSRAKGFVESGSNLIWDVAVTENGNVITTSIEEKTVKVWDLITHKLRCELKGNNFAIQVVEAKGRILVTGSHAVDGLIKIWDLESCTLLLVLEGHVGPIYSLALTEDKVISGAEDKTLKIWDIRTGELLHTLEGHSTYVDNIVVTPDRKVISANSFHDCKIKVWDLDSGEFLYHMEEEQGRYLSVRGMSISSAGNELWGWDGRRLKVWDTTSGKLLRILKEHSVKDNGRSISMIAGDKAVLLFGSSTLEIWDLITDQLVASFSSDSEILSCAVAPDKQTIVAGDRGGRLHFLRLVLPEDTIKSQIHMNS